MALSDSCNNKHPLFLILYLKIIIWQPFESKGHLSIPNFKCLIYQETQAEPHTKNTPAPWNRVVIGVFCCINPWACFHKCVCKWGCPEALQWPPALPTWCLPVRTNCTPCSHVCHAFHYLQYQVTERAQLGHLVRDSTGWSPSLIDGSQKSMRNTEKSLQIWTGRSTLRM